MKLCKTIPYIIISLFISLTSTFSQGNDTFCNLMPVPEKLIKMDGRFRLDTAFTISIKGNPDKRLYGSATRALKHLSGQTGFFFTQNFITTVDSIVTNYSNKSEFVIECKNPGKLVLNEDESYTLTITPLKIELSAETDLGAIHGLQTFLQLLCSDSIGYYFPAVKIIDKPRFQWRGLMIDVSRHFMPVDVIKRNLDAMTFLKMNVLHLHLSDDQGFRVESKTFPELTKLGSDGFYYTQQQIKDIISYAGERGIRVIPEFDIPGHSTSWLIAYPEFSSLPKDQREQNPENKIERSWGIFNPVFNPAKKATYQFFDKFFKEMSKLFPDEYIHIGGDENNGKDWSKNKPIQKFMASHHFSTTEQLQAYFTKRIRKIISKYHKKMIGWDEILQPGMPEDIVIQSWRGQSALQDAALKGYKGILSYGYYLDHCEPALVHYLNDPVPVDSILSGTAVKNILGGEAAMWSELVTPENIDSRIWPRTAAIAERLWSPASVEDVRDMYRRLDIINHKLEDCGVTQLKNYDMMLRRLTGGNDISALKDFVDVIEPLKGYARISQEVHYNSFSPYTRTVDAANPESNISRKFRNKVDEYLSGNKDAADNIISELSLWKENYPKLIEIIQSSPILREMTPMALNLKLLAEAGLKAINFINKNQKPDADWINESIILLEAAKKSYGQCELPVTSAFEKLFKVAAGK
ncbi:MAG: family 20 glycosylhydrolase [Ignavibacteriaceae bacterium]|jgi:hexosaminidase